MKKKQEKEALKVPEHGIISRPLSVLNSLPVAYRWEYTRRHAYYLLFWEPAHKHWQNPAKEEVEKMLEEAAVLMLQLIGVAGDPPPPWTKVEELRTEPFSKAWEDGAISVLTFHGMLGAMLTELPLESRAAIGNLLVKSTAGEEAGMPSVYQAMSDFKALKDSSLDKTPVAPIIGVNVNAPLRTILQAVESRVKEWKTQLGITEHRRRDDKLPSYLQVWDLREGWTGGTYDRLNEKSFSEIAHELRESLPTLVNRYRAAFRYIVGHDYRPDLWARIFGVYKTSEIIDSQAPNLALRRPWKSPEKREVPETLVAPERPMDHRGSFLENLSIVQDMQLSAELIMDVQTLLDKGYDGQRIAQELEVREPEVQEIIEYLHLRHDEGI